MTASIPARGYAARDKSTPLAPFDFHRRAPEQEDVRVEILYCGVCHTDLHLVRDDWGTAVYPMVPGHEIIGRVTEVGGAVAAVRIGDYVGVGCMVDSCRTCKSCRQHLEQYCENGVTYTYNSNDRRTGENTLGGYSSEIVVDQRFVVRVSESLDLKSVAPLLCAGITTYSPLRHWGAGPGKRVAIIGLGGLGHIAVKLARAMGAHVTVMEQSEAKARDAQRLGAHAVLMTSDTTAMQAHVRQFDIMLDTIPVSHDVNPFLNQLTVDGTLVLIGALSPIAPVAGANLMAGRRAIAGTSIGGMAETQEMMDFCAEHNVVCDVEMIGIEEVDAAFERLKKGEVKYRFVIDMQSLRSR